MTFSLLWRLLYWGWLASEVIVAIATRTRQGTGKVQDRGSLVILWVVIFASMTACIRISDSTPPDMFGGPHALKTAAVIVLVFGLVVRWSAIFTLGKSFSSNVAIHDSQQLNRSGLYRFVRHPSYLGLLLIFLAVGLHSRTWLSFACATVPTTVALLYRIHVEQSALVRAFGEEYMDYSKTTKRLNPGLY
jgi:protein-S-isoprenylcysteine O-methyltransferase Ste14